MRGTALCILVMLMFAGCVDETPTGTTDGTDTQYEDPEKDLTVDEPGTIPTTPPAPGERTLNETPTWRLGEWWTYEITSFFDDRKETIQRVVAGTEHGNYLVGFPIDEFNNFAMVMHHPAYGDIHREDLAYDTHDAPFTHLKFPLKVGDTWSTKWQNPNTVIDLEVVEVDHTTGLATIDITQTGTNPVTGQSQTTDFGQIIYEAELGEARKMTFNGYAQVEVIDHGYNYTGDVRVPHDHDLVFFHGRLAAQPIGNSTNNDGTVTDETITLPPEYDRVSFAIIIVDVPGFIANTGTGSGYYSQTATAPDGTQYSLEMRPDDVQAIKIEFFEHEDPDGDWELRTVAAGPGQVLFEGIGYHSIDIQLPSGCVIASQNALHHGSLCSAD